MEFYMTVSKYSISLPAGIVGEIQDREGDRSSIITQSLERYFVILTQARRSLRQKLSNDEMAMILDVLNGTIFLDTRSLTLVYAEIDDSLPDGLAEKWHVDGLALVEKLRSLSYTESVALVDAAERWWKTVSDGKQPQPADALKD